MYSNKDLSHDRLPIIPLFLSNMVGVRGWAYEIIINTTRMRSHVIPEKMLMIFVVRSGPFRRSGLFAVSIIASREIIEDVSISDVIKGDPKNSLFIGW
jgi:hypothetical protein